MTSVGSENEADPQQAEPEQLAEQPLKQNQTEQGLQEVSSFSEVEAKQQTEQNIAQ